MDKESKGFTITVVSIVLLIFFFTLAIGIVIGVFAVSEPDAGNLKFWSSLGDALNPLIGFISAVLVAAGLVYTARDFRLARREFEATAYELSESNRLLKDKNKKEHEKEGLGNAYKQIVDCINSLKQYEFAKPIQVHTLITIADKNYITGLDWDLAEDVQDLVSLVSICDAMTLQKVSRNHRLYNDTTSNSKELNKMDESPLSPIYWHIGYEDSKVIIKFIDYLKENLKIIEEYKEKLKNTDYKEPLKRELNYLKKFESVLSIYVESLENNGDIKFKAGFSEYNANYLYKVSGMEIDLLMISLDI